MNDSIDIGAEETGPVTIIRPYRGLTWSGLAELYRYRQLLKSMALRRLRARLDNLFLGVFWAIARPLMMTVVFVFIKRMTAAEMGAAIPYPAYLLAGLVLWFYMVSSISETANALSRDAGLIQKVYFPRLLSPAVPMLSNLIEIALGLLALVAMMIYFDLWPGWRVVLLPAIMLQLMAMILGVGLIFSALTLISRDWDQALRLILYIGLFVSPVIYAPERIPETVRAIYFLNPASGTLMGWRSCLFEDIPFPLMEWAYSCAFSLVALAIGLLIFSRAEHRLLDEM